MWLQGDDEVKPMRELELMSNAYTIESEIAAKTGKHHLRFRQVPIETVYERQVQGYERI